MKMPFINTIAEYALNHTVVGGVIPGSTTQAFLRHKNTTASNSDTIDTKLFHKTLKYAGVAPSNAADAAIRIWPNVYAYKNYPLIRDNLDEIIMELKDIVHILGKALHNAGVSKKKEYILETLEHSKKILTDLKQTKKDLVQTDSAPGPCTDTLMVTYLGAVLGPCMGAVIGPSFEVVGAASGALVGAAVGMAATRAGIIGTFEKNEAETESSDAEDYIVY